MNMKADNIILRKFKMRYKNIKMTQIWRILRLIT